MHITNICSFCFSSVVTMFIYTWYFLKHNFGVFINQQIVLMESHAVSFQYTILNKNHYFEVIIWISDSNWLSETRDQNHRPSSINNHIYPKYVEINDFFNNSNILKVSFNFKYIFFFIPGTEFGTLFPWMTCVLW